MCLLQKLHKARLQVVLIASTTLLSSVCLGGPYGDLQRQLRSVKSPEEVIQAVSGSHVASNQPDIKQEIESTTDADVDKKAIADNLREMVDMAAMAEERKPSSSDQAAASKIKQSPLYLDRGIDRKSNWLGDAINRLKNIRQKQPDEPIKIGPEVSAFGKLVTYVIWAILIGAVLGLLYYTIRYIDWRSALTRKARALLEEDEPERTLDEWLQLADVHSAAGRFREAVRALYLACLLKFDEHNVARFDRGETNWEHLERIRSSPLKPEDLDFTDATRRFDRIWYGYQTRGQVDVDEYRALYQNISERLKGVE